MMFTRGEYCDGSSTYGVICAHSKQDAEVLLVTSGTIASAYKTDGTNEYSYINPKAKEMYKVLKNGIAGCKAKNGEPMQFSLGSSMRHSYTKAKVDYSIELFDGEIVGASISWGDGCSIFLEYTDDKNLIPNGIPYVALTVSRITTDQVLDEVPVRSVEEIALEKEDVSWLKYKKYYVVNDDDTAEKIFSSLDNWTGPISYDTETTGLKINCFGKINSEYSRKLAEYNAANPDHQLRADRLVGIIFCVEENVSYYFPCFNRKFKNLYTSDTEARRKAISIIKDRYSKPHSNHMQDDMEDYFRKTPEDQWSPDVILMERVRGILEKRHIVAHNGSFEYKVGCLYGIDTNLKDDTMIMHQIMYKFRSTTSNRGEPSNLKYLAKVELGIDQWELSDFFPDFKEDKSGQVRAANKRGKKKGSKIDFSYMDYAGTRVYAPTDGDVTFLLFKKYKQDMMDNHKEQEYIYNVEVIVSCCIGYMEFFGHRLDERKIYGVRDKTKAELACIESEIRQAVGFSKPDEIDAYNHLKESIDAFSEVDNAGDEDARNNAINGMLESTESLYSVIAKNEENQLNLGSPAQVAELFYDVLGYPMQGDKRSVASKQIKPLLKAKNDDGTQAYPVANMYAEYKKKDTLLVKFYDNLPYFMYPGGYIFSSFGQISTATGRMSCSHPNAQQYPKAITGICIPRDGYVMMDADYSQIEYRVLTALAGNTELAHLFADPDSDYHTLMASKMYGVDYAAVTPKMRSDAKSFNFGIPYGMGFKSLAILLTGNSKPSSVDEAKEKYELYFKNQPRTRKFFDQVKEMALVNKYTRTHWCRYRYYSFTDANGNENNARKGAALRQAGNAVIQGCLGGDTLIQTKEFGIVKIKDVAGKRLHVWDGTSWALGDITYSGKKQKCIVTFSTGQEFVCSPIHKFLISSDNGDKNFIECCDLKFGDAVVYNKRSSLTVKGYKWHDSKDLNLTVKSVAITDEYIDMYDVCNTDNGYYVADGVITHNTAADIFKISVARNFMYIRENHLHGLLLIINMIHDEQLFEVNVQKLNMQRVLADVGKNMQFKVEGFPPLYIGAGIGPAWGKAKGKMAEIHPLLLEQFTEEAKDIPIFHEDKVVDTNEVLKYFAKRVLDFRRKKVRDYICDPNNYNKDLHPAIGNLLNLQFTYGHDKDKEGLNDKEFTQLCLDEFIKHEGIQGVDSSMFKAKEESMEDVEEDAEYTDGDEENEDDIEIGDNMFTVVDESDMVFGATIQDLIHQFKFFISPKYKVCGIDAIDMYYTKKDELVDYLCQHICDEDADGAMQIVFLQPGNILNRTGLYVNNISEDVVASKV